MGVSRGLEEFGAKMRGVAANIPGSVETVVRKVVLVVDQVAVNATPVDTGRARANWIVSVGSPAAGEPVGGPTFNSGAVTSLTAAATAMANYRVEQGGVFITNNVPYIGFLNAGSSAQAPNGMLEQALQAGVATARGEKVEIDIGSR